MKPQQSKVNHPLSLLKQPSSLGLGKWTSKKGEAAPRVNELREQIKREVMSIDRFTLKDLTTAREKLKPKSTEDVKYLTKAIIQLIKV